jgi:hypothetical protein
MLTQRSVHGQWLSGDEAQRRRLVEFNYHPAAWARRERLLRLCADDAPAKLLEAFDFDSARMNPGAERWLSRWVLSRWALEKPYTFVFEPVEARVALVSAEALAALAESLGLLCHSKTFRHCIHREERECLAREFGESRRRYALSATLLHGNESLRLPGAAENIPAGVLTLDHVRKTGWRCVLSCLTGAPCAALRRMELKLPADVELDAGEAGGAGREIWPVVERILRLEYPLEWRACCC